MGIKSARYETLLLTDADCVPASENWMQLMQDGYRPETEIVLGYGGYHPTSSLLNRIIRFETFHAALQYLSYALAGIPYMGVGRNLSYKKDVFLRNKGFSSINQIPGGDDDLFINQVANKHNTAIVIDREAHTLSEAKRTGRLVYAKNPPLFYCQILPNKTQVFTGLVFGHPIFGLPVGNSRCHHFQLVDRPVGVCRQAFPTGSYLLQNHEETARSGPVSFLYFL